MQYKYQLSVLIPANNEMFLARTIQDLVENTGPETEIIAVLDGGIWADPAIKQHERVNVIYVPTTIGQRAAAKLAGRLAQGKYIAKVDAHCSFDKGFDRKMLEMFTEEGDNIVAVPIMRNLHAFDWKCYHCGWKKDQGPTPPKCEKCGKTDKIRRKMTWDLRPNKYSQSYSFDSEPHFQYFGEYKQRPEYIDAKAKTGHTETMSLQGSFFMMTKEKYFDYNIDNEEFGSWGQQGAAVALFFWLSGGRVLVNHKTWYAHMFRTQGGDFSFPYAHINNVDSTKQRVWEHFFNGKFKQQIHKPSWLVEKFWPIPINERKDANRGIGWTPEALKVLKEKERQSPINML
jgi:glycosyltransferase involved in cell wall biosynthesis